MKDLYYIKLVKEIEILFEKIKMTKANLKKENNISKLNEYKHDCYILLKKLNLAKKMAFSLNTEDYNKRYITKNRWDNEKGTTCFRDEEIFK